MRLTQSVRKHSAYWLLCSLVTVALAGLLGCGHKGELMLPENDDENSSETAVQQ